MQWESVMWMGRFYLLKSKGWSQTFSIIWWGNLACIPALVLRSVRISPTTALLMMWSDVTAATIDTDVIFTLKGHRPMLLAGLKNTPRSNDNDFKAFYAPFMYAVNPTALCLLNWRQCDWRRVAVFQVWWYFSVSSVLSILSASFLKTDMIKYEIDKKLSVRLPLLCGAWMVLKSKRDEWPSYCIHTHIFLLF